MTVIPDDSGVSSRLLVYDMDDPANPFFVEAVNPPGYGISTHVTVSGGVLFADMSGDGATRWGNPRPVECICSGLNPLDR
jgi:hypothetical protein